MKAVNLKTEYLTNPIGVNFTAPRLFWNCEGDIKQTAYQIVCRLDSGRVIWETGKVSGDSMRVTYKGKPLRERDRILWQVRLWNENDQPGAWSETAFFEAGISVWQAKWIAGNYSVHKKTRYPVDCFLKVIAIPKRVRKARLYISACGLYEARLNGQKVGDFCLAPGLTDYRKRVQAQTYDITSALTIGDATLTIQLADGWYRGSVGGGATNAYGVETKLIAQLEIEYCDNERSTVITDESWRWSNDGPIRFADNKDGEIIVAGNAPSYKGYAKVTNHTVFPVPSNNNPVTERERFHPMVTTAPNGKKLLDFGQNMAGYIAFRVRAHKGARMVWQCGELLDEDGNLTLKNIQTVKRTGFTPLQKIEYVCREGLNEYKTTFAVFGFRYAEVETELELNSEDIEAVAVYSDIQDIGSFESSNSLLDRFVSCTRWSAKSNSLDIPTDCPQRERMGWTGDAQIFFQTAGYLFDYAAFSKKHLRDIYDWQEKSGRLPQIAPAGGVDIILSTMNGSVGWADAGILIPYRFWKLYGDRDILIEFYEGMRKYAEFMIGRCGKNGFMAKRLKLSGEAKRYIVNAGQSYDEWAEPTDVYSLKWTDMVAPHPEVSTAYTAYALGLMAEIAKELGKNEDAARYDKISAGCKLAYQELCELPEFSLDTDRQARLVRPLYFGLLNEKQTMYAKNRLLKALGNYGWRLGTGFLSTPLILDVLADIDIEAAYRVLENEELPGWLYMPKKGATTIWESWEGAANTGNGSLNHYSKGAVCEWLFRTMCGIRTAGENHFVIAPRPGGSFSFAKATFGSIYGFVESGWKREGAKIVYEIVIPSNCSAEVRLPDGRNHRISAGKHSFTLPDSNTQRREFNENYQN